MNNEQKSYYKKRMKSVLGIEPAPPIGGHAVPPGKSDRRQFIAFVASFVLISLLAVAVVKFDLLSFSFRDIPIEEQLPGREVITPTPAHST